ncbi:MAG: carboxypeptidase, partial [Chloroflexi bacterium]
MTNPITEAVADRSSNTLALLEEIVKHESPTNEKSALDQLTRFLQEQISLRNGAVERLQQDVYGDLLVARWPGNPELRPLFVMTHVDTVWPIGTLQRLPWRQEDGRQYGPGVFDMKASVAMMLTAIEIIQALGLARRPIVWMINTEEEVGSPVSRPVLERLALEAEYVLCLEPP